MIEHVVPDQSQGVAAHRNPLKILNHLPYLQNKRLLGYVVRRGAVFPEEASEAAAMYAKARHVEFHPSDLCNLSCSGCTYGGDRNALSEPTFFPLDSVEQLALLDPASMIIVGGGEPTLYRWKGAGFDVLIEKLMAVMPWLRLALVTNGTFVPPGSWPAHVEWIRLSVDAASPSSYAAVKGHPFFDSAIASFFRYLDSPIQRVGLGFLYSGLNVSEYVRFAEMVYDAVMGQAPHHMPKVEIQYRPLRFDYPFATPKRYVVTEADRDAIRAQLEGLIVARPEMIPFLKEQTNVLRGLYDSPTQKQKEPHCYYAEAFKIVRANGDVYPCCMGIASGALKLGNLLSDSMEHLGLATATVVGKSSAVCQEGCHYDGLNRIARMGMEGVAVPSMAPLVRSDPMF